MVSPRPRVSNLRRSWLERLLAVVRELGAISDIDQTLNRIAEATVEFLEFGAAAINVVDAGGQVVVRAVAGPPGIEQLLGRGSSVRDWQDLLDAADPWGSLRFFSHKQDRQVLDRIATWTGNDAGAAQPGDWHNEDLLFAPLFDQDGSLLGVLSVDQPASGERPDLEQRTVLELFANQAAVAIAESRARDHAEARRWEAEHRWQVTFERSPIGAAIVNPSGVLVQVNESLAKMLGFSREQLLGRSFDKLTHPDDVDLDTAVFHQLVGGSRDTYESLKRMVHADGHLVYGLLHVGVIRNSAGELQNVVAQINDMTQRKQAEDRLAHRAMHDPLTELPNRTLLQELLAGYLNSGRPAGVLYCDLDRFKIVNDSLGHEAGDELLLVLSHRLRDALPACVTLGRVGGDEFVALVPDVNDPERLHGLAQGLASALQQPLVVRGHLHTASLSIGITVSGPGHDHPDEVLREADLALLRAKRRGRSRIEMYDPTQDKPVTLHELELEHSLRSALAENRGLVPYFQPIVNLLDNTAVGHEALVRWEHAEQGLLDPDDFLPMAEQTGLIVPLGWWMLATCCRAAGDARLTGGSAQWVAVNASGSQLGRGQLVPEIRRGLDASGLSPDRLHLEITESALVEASPAAIKEVREVADLGVRIALDDFGTGYSSLSLLRDLPVSTVKIDRSFVAPIAADRSARAIVRSVIGLCQELGITTVAEGIETQEQLTSVRALGCNHGQGYLLGRPLPLD
ncbi:MAG TPA: EAL domain-containing protein [Jatrophihabitans sp.]|jgi:diguanylate cyclase (GGDEF)-like protein/PAS domain S-box-containing protein|uniref:putative bifunctional diguanylate cyclase/phosphodiesterase n=1 Tax=Jatrophihabitans sp. TaxID=1932789 RepID=UPI002F083434